MKENVPSRDETRKSLKNRQGEIIFLQDITLSQAMVDSKLSDVNSN